MTLYEEDIDNFITDPITGKVVPVKKSKGRTQSKTGIEGGYTKDSREDDALSGLDDRSLFIDPLDKPPDIKNGDIEKETTIDVEGAFPLLGECRSLYRRLDPTGKEMKRSSFSWMLLLKGAKMSIKKKYPDIPKAALNPYANVMMIIVQGNTVEFVEENYPGDFKRTMNYLTNNGTTSCILTLDQLKQMSSNKLVNTLFYKRILRLVDNGPTSFKLEIDLERSFLNHSRSLLRNDSEFERQVIRKAAERWNLDLKEDFNCYTAINSKKKYLVVGFVKQDHKK